MNMEISNVKDLGIVYLVNDKYSVPKDSLKNRYYRKVQEWLGKGNSLTERWTIDELKFEHSDSIKTEEARRIDIAYPEWQQRDYMVAVAEIHNKEIMAMKATPFEAQYTVTTDELQTMRDAETCKAVVTDIRVKSNELQTSLDSMTLDQLKAFDPTDDSNWT